MNASPVRAVNVPPGYLALPAPRETVLALLRQIDAAEQDWDAQAAVAALDPALAFELLVAAPDPARGDGFDLRAVLADRMAELGPELLRAWCLDKLAWAKGHAEACDLRQSLHGLFVAELAVHLAVELNQGGFQEAYAAGLLHDVGQLWLVRHAEGHAALKAAAKDEAMLSAAEIERYGIGHAGLGAALSGRCGLPAAVVEAIHLHHCALKAMGDAAPLARVVWLAEEIAGSRFEVSDHDLGIAAGASGLDAGTLNDLRADVARRLASVTKEFGIPTAGARRAGPPAGPPAAETRETGGGWDREDPVSAAAVSALARGALLDTADDMSRKLAATCRLLLDLGTPLLVEFDGSTEELRGMPDDERPWAADVRLGASTPGSVVARAHRGGSTLQCVFGAQGPEDSAGDWQIARRLGAEGLLCEPWFRPDRRGIAVFGLHGPYDPDRIRSAVRRALVDSAVAARMRRLRDEEIRREAETELRASYREHHRRLAHEAGNPLTVIRTYLGVIRGRLPGSAALDAEFALLDQEIDHVASMVRSAALPPAAPPAGGADSVDVVGLLEDLRLLYGEALFASRGIGFELHAGEHPVRGCMPRDALKQVLLNLFRNASEALQAGQRFSVTLIPAANFGGLPCLGIRLADNGAGIGPETMAGLFERARSAKGGEHQGVGLVLVREILARHRSHVVCESDGRTGTVFQVYIPLAGQT